MWVICLFFVCEMRREDEGSFKTGAHRGGRAGGSLHVFSFFKKSIDLLNKT